MKGLALVVPPVAIFTGDIFAVNGMAVGEVSDAFFGDVLIIPAGFAFSIWGLIYFGILALAVAQAWPGHGDNPHFEEARIPLIANMICNFGWIVFWQSLVFPVATAILVLQFATAVWLYYAMGIPSRPAFSKVETWIRPAMSLYLGWLTVATVVGVAVLLNYWEWGAFGLSMGAWVSIMLVIVAAVGFALTLWWDDPVYTLALVWGLIGVALRPDQAGVVMVTAVVAVLFLALVIGIQVWVGIRKRQVQPAVVG